MIKKRNKITPRNAQLKMQIVSRALNVLPLMQLLCVVSTTIVKQVFFERLHIKPLPRILGFIFNIPVNL